MSDTDASFAEASATTTAVGEPSAEDEEDLPRGGAIDARALLRRMMKKTPGSALQRIELPLVAQ